MNDKTQTLTLKRYFFHKKQIKIVELYNCMYVGVYTVRLHSILTIIQIRVRFFTKIVSVNRCR